MPHARIPPNLTQGPRPPTALSAANLYCAVPPLPPSPPTTQPRWPYCNKRPPVAPPFYGPFQPLGLITGGITGLQHALAMAGGLVTPPILIGTLCPDPATRTCETSMTGLSGLCVGGGGAAQQLTRAQSAQRQSCVKLSAASFTACRQDQLHHPYMRPNGIVQPSSSSHHSQHTQHSQHTNNLPSCPADLIQAALLVCGIMTFIQVTGLRWRTSQYQWGAGILSVMGISFASVPLFTTVITQQMVGRSCRVSCRVTAFVCALPVLRLDVLQMHQTTSADCTDLSSQRRTSIHAHVTPGLTDFS